MLTFDRLRVFLSGRISMPWFEANIWYLTNGWWSTTKTLSFHFCLECWSSVKVVTVLVVVEATWQSSKCPNKGLLLLRATYTMTPLKKLNNSLYMVLWKISLKIAFKHPSYVTLPPLSLVIGNSVSSSGYNSWLSKQTSYSVALSCFIIT